MAVNFLLKRTSSGDKRPTAAQLDVGELGLNYEAGDPGLFFEDSNGAVRKVGPCTVGGTAPNTNPAGSTGNSTGELWLDNSGGDNVLKIYDGTSWQTAASDNVSTATELTGPVVFTAQAAVALTFGDVVYISGASGDTPIVSKAQANSSATMPAYGFAGEDIASGATGKIITFGSIEGDGSTPLDTSNLTVNDVVYVSSATAGAWTTTKPTGEGSLLQNIGRIQRVNSQNGVIKVGGAGRASATPNLNEGNIFIGDSSNESSTSSLTAALSTHAGISSSADAVAVTIDSSERVGIGTTTPLAKLDISGDGANSSRVYITQANDTTDGVDVTGYRARGTVASPASLAASDAIFKLFAQAYDGSAYVAAGNMGWTASDGSGNSTFSLKTRVGSSVGDRLTIDSSGDTTLTGALDVNNDFKVATNVFFADVSQKTISVNTNFAYAVLDVYDSGTAMPMAQFTYSEIDTAPSEIILVKTRGTNPLPGNVNDGDSIGRLTMQAYAGDQLNNSAQIVATADGTDGDATMALRTMVGTTLADRLTITATGDVNATGGVSAGTTSSPFQASAANDVVTKNYGESVFPTAKFGINAHAAWDASAGAAFDWSTDKISEGNITSVVRTAIGKFTVTFDTDFDSANYTAICTAGGLDHSGITAGGRTVSVLSRSAGSMDIVVERADDAANDDCEYISVMVIGTLS